jgi:hypothetical protein
METGMPINNPRQWGVISAAICIVFVAFALTFGMSEWRQGDAATAHAPAETTVR